MHGKFMESEKAAESRVERNDGGVAKWGQILHAATTQTDNHFAGNIDEVQILDNLIQNPLNVVTVMEIKISKRLTNADIEHIATFCEKLLELLPRRLEVIGTITDCHYIKFLRVARDI
ncbi:hypothetical protein G9A89_001280 [Geosiphon pyriformis]|nr:hypothetical protein G9A89_001280 [Geosiphon pyriformis]